VLHAEEQQTDYALHLPGERLDAAHGRDHRLRVLRALALHGTH
jgi:hypothetical protein